MARGPKCKLGDVWDSRASASLRNLVNAMGYLPLDDRVLNECWTELFNKEIEILAKEDENWRTFKEYVLSTYIVKEARISPLGKIYK